MLARSGQLEMKPAHWRRRDLATCEEATAVNTSRTRRSQMKVLTRNKGQEVRRLATGPNELSGFCVGSERLHFTDHSRKATDDTRRRFHCAHGSVRRMTERAWHIRGIDGQPEGGWHDGSDGSKESNWFHAERASERASGGLL